MYTETKNDHGMLCWAPGGRCWTSDPRHWKSLLLLYNFALQFSPWLGLIADYFCHFLGICITYGWACLCLHQEQVSSGGSHDLFSAHTS